jgi:hypothetical protein
MFLATEEGVSLLHYTNVETLLRELDHRVLVKTRSIQDNPQEPHILDENQPLQRERADYL